MRSPSQSLINGLAIAACATLVAGIVSAFSVGSGTSQSTATSSSSGGQTTTSVAQPGVPTTTAGTPSASPTTTSRSATPGGPTSVVTTAAPLPTAAGPVGDPGQPTAEAQGTYMYTYTYNSGSGQPTSGTLDEKVTTTASAGGTTRQTVVDSGPDVHASQNRTVEWRTSGYYEVQRTFNFNGQSATCTWSPSILEAPTGLAVGRSWALTGSCTVNAYGQSIAIHLTGTAKISGKQRVMVGTDAVNVWVLNVNYTATASNAVIGTFTIHYDGVDKTAARLGELVEEDANETVTSQQSSQPQTAHTHEALKSIHPS